MSGEYRFNTGDTWAEGLLYVADAAYALRHDNQGEAEIREAIAEQFPAVMHYDSMQRTLNCEPYNGADLQAHYPQLVAEIAELHHSGLAARPPQLP